MRYTISKTQMSIFLIILVYTPIAINAAQTGSPETGSSMIHSDVKTTGAYTTAAAQQIPDDPLQAVTKTKQPPVDSGIRYEKVRDMPLERLYQARQYYLWDNNVDVAIHVIQRILTLEEDQNAAAYYMVELGDLYRLKEDYNSAKTIYTTFLNLYPGSIHVEPVYFRLFTCHENCLCTPDRDQTETRNMISRATTYLNTYGEYGDYTKKARDLIRYGYQLLCKSELETFDFYLNKYTYTNAASSLRAAYYRLKYIYDELVSSLSEQQSQQAAKALAHALQHISIDTLDDTYPQDRDHVYTQLCNIHQELHAIFDEQTTWRINPLRRF